MNRPKNSVLLLFSLFFSFFIACEEERIYEKSLKIPHAEWERLNKAQFEFEIKDSTANYSFQLNFRHGGDYPYKNIYLFTKTISPNGKVAIDTAQMILSDRKGRWMGKGIGDIYDYQFKFKEGSLFPSAGKYQFEIEQAMRDQTVSEVTDIGISIIKINE